MGEISMDDMKCARDKYWSECNDQEKMERMRTIVKQLQRENEQLMKDTYRLQQHQHSTDGKLLVPIGMDNDRPLRGRYNSEWI